MSEQQDNKYTAKALSFQRAYTLLVMLKDEFAFELTGKQQTLKVLEAKFGKKSPQYLEAKDWFDAHSYGYDTTVNTIRKIDASFKDKWRVNIIKSQLTTERIKDLQSFLDQILEVKNIDVLTDILRLGIQETKGKIL